MRGRVWSVAVSPLAQLVSARDVATGDVGPGATGTVGEVTDGDVEEGLLALVLGASCANP